MSTEVSGESIRTMVVDLLKDDSIAEIGVSEKLEGLVDSFTLVELLSVLEEKFKIKFQAPHLGKEHWVSFDTIAKLVTKVRAGGK